VNEAIQMGLLRDQAGLDKMGEMGDIFHCELPPPIKSPRPADEDCSSTRNGSRRGYTMDNSTEAAPIDQTIAAALSELGLPHSPCRSTSFLVQDGYCTGQRFLFDGIEAIWLIAENTIRFYDENDRMLKSVGFGTAQQHKAA